MHPDYLSLAYFDKLGLFLCRSEQIGGMKMNFWFCPDLGGKGVDISVVDASWLTSVSQVFFFFVE